MKILPLLIFSLIAFQLTAQEYKTYYDQTGKETDSVNAQTYNLTRRTSDSTWYSKEYNTNDKMLTEGSYLDKELKVPHGQFKFYSYNHSYLTIPVPGGNYLKLTGEFNKGQKNGKWTTYFPNGQIEFINTFENNIENGLYERYNYESGKVDIRGYFAGGLRDGQWSMLDQHEQVYQIEIYKKGELMSNKTVASPISCCTRTREFDNYLKEHLTAVIVPNLQYANIVVSVKITEQGRLTAPKFDLFRRGTFVVNSKKDISVKDLSPDQKLSELTPAIEKVIMENPFPWKPAYNKKTKTPVSESSTFVIVVNKARLEITDIPALHKMPPEILGIN